MSDSVSGSGAVTADPRTPAPSLGELSVRDTAIAFPHVAAPTFAPRPVESEGEGGIDFRRVAHALRRRWLPALALGVVLATAAAVPTYLFLPRGYEAVTWLRIRGTGGLLGGTADFNEYEAYRKTQLQLLKSPIVLNAALRRPGISSLRTITEQDDPVTWLGSSIQPVVNAQSEILQIKLRSSVAEDAAKILNAVTACYLDDIVNKDRQDRLGKRDMLEKKFKENQTELRSRKETFNELARTLGTRDSTEVSTQRALLMDHLASLRQGVRLAEADLAAIDLELAMIEAQEGDIGEGGGDGGGGSLVDVALSREPEVGALEARIAELSELILDRSQRSARGMNEVSVKRMMSQREQLIVQLDELREQLRPRVSAALAQGLGGRPSRVAGLSPAVIRLRREALLKTIEENSEELEQVTKEVLLLGQANADLEVRRSEIEQLERVTNQIGLQLESSSLDLTAPPRVSLVDEATVPTSNDGLKRVALTVITGLLGLALGTSTIVFAEYLRNRLNAPEEIPQRLGLRVIGTLPWVGKTRRGRENEHRVAENVDAIRTLLLHGASGAPKVIMVTSPGDREGKSSVAANLAASIARSDKRTLLLEGNLRAPSVHAALQLDPATPGLAEVLRGEAANNDVVQPTVIDGLFAVTAGTSDYDAINALSRPDLGKILRGYRESFDHVVIDACPVLAFADALMMGQHADIAVLATMRDMTSVPSIGSAAERLRSAGVRVVGCIVSGTRESPSKGGARRLKS